MVHPMNEALNFSVERMAVANCRFVRLWPAAIAHLCVSQQFDWGDRECRQ